MAGGCLIRAEPAAQLHPQALCRRPELHAAGNAEHRAPAVASAPVGASVTPPGSPPRRQHPKRRIRILPLDCRLQRINLWPQLLRRYHLFSQRLAAHRFTQYPVATHRRTPPTWLLGHRLRSAGRRGSARSEKAQLTAINSCDSRQFKPPMVNTAPWRNQAG